MSAGQENNCEQLWAVPLLCAWSRNRCCCQCVEVHTWSHDSGPCFGLLNGFRWQHGAVHIIGVSLAVWWQVLFAWSKPYRQCVDTGQIRDSRNDEMRELYYLTWRPRKSTSVYLFFNSKSFESWAVWHHGAWKQYTPLLLENPNPKSALPPLTC